MIRAGGMEVALLRRTGQAEEARARLAYWQSVDPPSSFLRHEAVLLGARGRGAVDAPRGGSRAGARAGRRLHGARPVGRRARAARPPLSVGRRRGRAGDGPAPGLPARGLLPRLLRREGRAAPGGRTSPSPRASPPATSSRTVPSLSSSSGGRWRRTRRDATAHFLLGSLLLSGGQSDAALGEWEKARALDPRLPVLHRNIGFTLLYARGAAADALRVFEEGMAADPTNVELYQGADQALSLLGRGPEERIASLAPVPRDAPALDARLQAGPRARGGGALRRGARRSSPGASSRARSSARTCGRSTSR